MASVCHYRSIGMDQQDTTDKPTGKQRPDKGKMIFLGVIILAVVLVYISQQSGAELPDWPDDLPAALAKARQEDRKVLVFFAGSPPSENARSMSTRTLAKNGRHISSRKLIKVLIQLKTSDELARRYNVRKLPTFVLLDSQGAELNRRVGFVGEVSFREDFLDCQRVEKP